MLQPAAAPGHAEPPKADAAPPKADGGPPKPPLPFDDRPLMLAGSAAFGIAIPLLTGLYGPLTPAEGRWWAGFAGFVVLAFVIWWGNRWLLFKQREHLDWFRFPWRKLGLLVSANVLYTAPVTAAGLAAWFAFAGLPTDAQALKVVVLTNVICVIFVTHAYETVFLIRERESDLLRVERLERMRAESELGALKAQIDPHFLFNSLNTLGHLVTHDERRAREFCDLLAEVYRYVLASRQRDLVPLAEELDFVRQYHRLLALRFGHAIRLEIDPVPAPADRAARLPPLALQTLLENAVKHNQAGEELPLVVRLRWRDDAVEVSNPLQRRSSLKRGEGLGLRNLDERCRLLMGRALEVSSSGPDFRVRVPLSVERPA